MDLMDCRDYILSLPEIEECQLFDVDVVVYKICGKWFAVVIFSRGGYLALKCNPDRAISKRGLCQDRRGVNFCNLHLRLMLLMMQSYFIDSVSALYGS